jgi:hypothetical protein
MNGYRTSFTAGDGMLNVRVDGAGGDAVARFSWRADETDGAIGELAAALDAMGQMRERREQCKHAQPAGKRRRPRQSGAEVSMLDGIDQAIRVLELGAVTT